MLIQWGESMPANLEQLRGGLVVSCQPVPGGPMDRPEIVTAFALAGLAGGAAGLRIEGVTNLRAVRAATTAPIIGLVKRDLEGSPVRITPLLEDVRTLAAAGADIIAFDATRRPRPVPAAELVAEIRACGKLAMADCATVEDGQTARAMGVEILGSTMSGYVGGPVPEMPDLSLVRALSTMGAFVLAEGRYHVPALAAQAIRAGADAVVAGSAITRTEHVTSWFVEAIQTARQGVVTSPVLAVDLGGSKILAALVEGAKVLERAEVATDRSGGAAAWIEQVGALVRSWAGRYSHAGISVTGLVKDGMWRALNPGTLDIPPDFPLAHQAEELLDMPVVLANDAQAAAWGEYRHGAGRGGDLVFLTISTGIGGGAVANGRLLSGRGGLAGSFGQILPLPDGTETLMEDMASGRFIAAEGARLGLAADARAVFRAAAAGHAGADRAITVSASRVARLCLDIQRMFDPARIVIGGGVGLAPGYLERVSGELAHLPDLMRPTLVPAALGRDAGVIGIAELAAGNTNSGEET